ncbi:MAG TPA: hypothetical protein VJS20_04610 [Gemmatimonadales bacterium]|nr:hypothetical protein [Gemmatimonadales bacterium]
MNRLSSFGFIIPSGSGRAALATVLAMLALAPAVHAQVVQTIDFPASQITGAWAAGGCGTGNERGIATNGAAATMTWNDTTGANNSTVVQIQIEAAWKFWCAGGGYTVAVNGTDMGAGGTPTNTNNCSCNAAPFETSTQVIGPGSFAWTPNGSNTISFTCTSASWIGVMDNATNWSVRITVTLLNQPPLPPAGAVQLNASGQTIPVGGTTNSTTLRMRATITDPDNDDCFLEAEVQPTAIFFFDTPNFAGTPSPAGNNAFVEATGLGDGGYHWQVRAVDPFDFTSPWQSFGNNSEALPDVLINTTAAPVAKAQDNENHSGGDCDISVGAGGGLLSPALAALALLGFGLARRRR